MPKKKYVSPDRERMVKTRYDRYGPDTYKKTGLASQTFKKNPEVQKKASLKRWHPEYFDQTGKLLPKYEHLMKENKSEQKD